MTSSKPQIDVDKLMRDAEQGDAAAQFGLASLYMLGKVLQKSEQEGAKWLKLSAENGFAEAQCALGKNYLEGAFGAQKSEVKALEWFEKAADNNHAEAQYVLGQAYLNGKYGLKKSAEQAQKWLMFAGKNGHKGAYVAFYHLFAKGIGVHKLKDQQSNLCLNTLSEKLKYSLVLLLSFMCFGAVSMFSPIALVLFVVFGAFLSFFFLRVALNTHFIKSSQMAQSERNRASIEKALSFIKEYAGKLKLDSLPVPIFIPSEGLVSKPNINSFDKSLTAFGGDYTGLVNRWGKSILLALPESFSSLSEEEAQFTLAQKLARFAFSAKEKTIFAGLFLRIPVIVLLLEFFITLFNEPGLKALGVMAGGYVLLFLLYGGFSKSFNKASICLFPIFGAIAVGLFGSADLLVTFLSFLTVWGLSSSVFAWQKRNMIYQSDRLCIALTGKPKALTSSLQKLYSQAEKENKDPAVNKYAEVFDHGLRRLSRSARKYLCNPKPSVEGRGRRIGKLMV